MYAKIIFVRFMEYGYSQQELAIKANTGLKTISRAEGALDNLSIKIYNKIFHTLKLSAKDVAEAMIQLKSSDKEQASTSFYRRVLPDRFLHMY